MLVVWLSDQNPRSIGGPSRTGARARARERAGARGGRKQTGRDGTGAAAEIDNTRLIVMAICPGA